MTTQTNTAALGGVLTPPLSLPRFTFLCGRPNNGQKELVSAINILDDAMCTHDFKEPLRNAIRGLFDLTHEIDLLDPKHGDEYAPCYDSQEGEWGPTMWDLQDNLQDFLAEQLHSGYLGRLALRDLLTGPDDIFDRHIFRDCESRNDIYPFIARFNERSCLCIHCGPLNYPIIDRPTLCHIWLPTVGTEDRMAQIRRHLDNPILMTDRKAPA